MLCSVVGAPGPRAHIFTRKTAPESFGHWTAKTHICQEHRRVGPAVFGRRTHICARKAGEWDQLSLHGEHTHIRQENRRVGPAAFGRRRHIFASITAAGAVLFGRRRHIFARITAAGAVLFERRRHIFARIGEDTYLRGEEDITWYRTPR